MVFLCGYWLTVSAAQAANTSFKKGQAIAAELCQACHQFQGADQAGTVGPPLVSIAQRFPQRERLRDIIQNPQQALNPFTMMPPFGRHGFVSDDDIEVLIEFLYSL